MYYIVQREYTKALNDENKLGCRFHRTGNFFAFLLETTKGPARKYPRQWKTMS
jgi:hypothetical protein